MTEIISDLNTLISIINDLPANEFAEKADQKRNALINTVNGIIAVLDSEDPSAFNEAYDKLLHDVKPKLTGLKTDENEVPWGSGIFENPWIVNATSQLRFRDLCNVILTSIKNWNKPVSEEWFFSFENDIVGLPPTENDPHIWLLHGTLTVENDRAYAGNNSLKATPDDAGHYFAFTKTLPSFNNYKYWEVSGYFCSDCYGDFSTISFGAMQQSLTFYGDPIDQYLGYVLIAFSGPRIFYASADQLYNGPVGPVLNRNIWYFVRIGGNLDTQTYRFQIWNAETNELVYEQSNIPFYAPCTYVKYLGVAGGGQHGNETTWMDNLSLKLWSP